MTKFETYINEPLEFQRDLLAVYDQNDVLIVFDIGACEGEDSIRYARLFPNSTVWAFEPLPQNYKKAYFNVVKYRASNVRLSMEALGNRLRNSRFHVSSGIPAGVEDHDGEWDYGNKSSSLLEPSEHLKTYHNWLSFKQVLEVPTNTLENFCDSHEISMIDIAHVDVQGAELMVLEGAGELLHSVGVVRLEVEKVPLYKNQPLQKDIEVFMKKHGFKKVRDTVGAVSGDQLYINRRLYLRYMAAKIARLTIKGIKTTTQARRAHTRANFEKDDSLRYRKGSFSQSGEDLIVDFILRGRGIQTPTYLDIGASHPWDINNTALFYKQGSRGITVEPNPLLFEEIARERPRDTNLNIGVGENATESDFYLMSSPTLSTFSKVEADRYVHEGVCQVEKVLKVSSDTFNNILASYFFDTCPDFVSLDTEGFEAAILATINFDKYRPKVICVETITYSTTGHGQKDREIAEFLKSKGYLVYADTHINTIFVLADFWLV